MLWTIVAISSGDIVSSVYSLLMGDSSSYFLGVIL